MSRRSRTVAAAALVGAQFLVVGSAEAAVPGRNGKIWFTQETSSGGRLASIDASGKLRPLPRQGKYDASQASVSPDGRRIVFQSYRNGNSELYVVRTSGRGLRRLTRSDRTYEQLPTWSPDGRRIAFEAGLKGSPEQDVYVIRADGRGKRKRLTNAPGSDGAPAWSPDGRWIAFHSNRPGSDGYDVFVMAANGTGERAITRFPNDEGEPSWSPTGTRLAISSGVFDPTVGAIRDEIVTINPDGSAPVRLTTDPSTDFTPAWSPNGKRIAFVSGRTGNLDVHTMRAADGSDVRRMSSRALPDTHVDWAVRKR